ncbi:unnamed protein product [Sphagnum troendelagicum]|uniref:Uncharacterized protein n=1 Tax=Sphagnum troendelagicum TaxID=128251 RepID=A0ABP0UK03_9BRYO
MAVSVHVPVKFDGRQSDQTKNEVFLSKVRQSTNLLQQSFSIMDTPSTSCDGHISPLIYCPPNHEIAS